MEKRNPYSIIKKRHFTEKASVLLQLQGRESNASVKACKNPKYVFEVDSSATKQDIAWAFQEIYAKSKVKVVAVNTINMKPQSRRFRGRMGAYAGFKKAIVTLEPGQKID